MIQKPRTIYLNYKLQPKVNIIISSTFASLST